jgi:hypothetical protein
MTAVERRAAFIAAASDQALSTEARPTLKSHALVKKGPIAAAKGQ